MTLRITIKIRDTQHNGTRYYYAECHGTLSNAIDVS
jgi:hypothetical protein